MHILHKWIYDTKNTRTCPICHLHQYLISNPITHSWLTVGCAEYKQWVDWNKNKEKGEQLAMVSCTFKGG